MTVRVLINGSKGRMGCEAVLAVNADSELELVAECGRGDDLAATIQSSQCDVVVDLTIATAAFDNCKTIIEQGAHPVIGTSGLLPDQVEQLQSLCEDKQLGGIIVPNFSIGAVLMMQYSAAIAKYLPDVEIIEMHHDGKLDAPSGTAVKTAQMIANNRGDVAEKTIEQKELLSGALGAKQDDITIHSVRLPGLVAHQQVIFGGCSETLTLRHDSIHRQSFMPGLCLACKKAPELNGLLYGLEKILIT